MDDNEIVDAEPPDAYLVVAAVTIGDWLSWESNVVAAQLVESCPEVVWAWLFDRMTDDVLQRCDGLGATVQDIVWQVKPLWVDLELAS